MIKFARIHDSVLATLTDPMEKLAYMQGAGDAAASLDAEDAGGPPEIPGGGEGPQTLEEVAVLLSQMVEAGQIDEQTAADVMQELAAAEGGHADAVPEEPEAKAAFTLFQQLAA